MFGGATWGFAQLAALDGSQDSKVDANDNALADLAATASSTQRS